MANQGSLRIDSLFSVKDKIALVTGGSSGIGYMIAKALTQNGAKVYISSRKAKACEEVAKELTQLGPGKCFSIPADLVNEANCKKLVQEFEKHESKLHILFNNAGATWGGTFEEYPEAAWNKIYSLNVFGLFALTRELVPFLQRGSTPEDPARVINISSVASFATTKFDNHFAYSTSKAAVTHLTRVLSLQLADKGINVNTIAPGLFPSKMTKFYLDNENTKEVAISSIPMKRHGNPEDMGGLAVFLSSKASAYIDGATIVIDGGQSVGSGSRL